MTKNAQKKSTTVRTRRAIVNLLKQKGAMDSQELANCLHISAMAVRQHLYALQDERLVTYEEEPREMGRPAKLWQLTSDANRLFPDGYAELTLGLIQAINQAFGNTGLDKLLEIRTQQQLAAYQAQICSFNSLAERLAALVELRSHEGYMAQSQTLEDGSFLLIENHCPICAAATACTGLCEQELTIFQSVLGENVKVEREEHIITGARRCVYRVSPHSEKL
ncbi:helix-turn-helix transcriptional regulator [Nodularia sp. NIES-3585]|uniref:helix-turn-helix transcriptional regulator n=1 Tax=Nodularia sp. NIES-3585 TaxID=1973477 RepID=UPI000B5C6918|nr:metalloregulator ArsR/SmtB family transcription factor [Nodularia sp. NIES-3585]GAX35090.1 transcriptional regulator [Nodularia sp. NIES-3585]